MRSLRQEHLASALQLEKASIKAKSQNFNWETEKLDEQSIDESIDDREDLRGGQWRCFAADSRETVPACSSASAYSPNN
jgi:hypothetical protein